MKRLSFGSPTSPDNFQNWTQQCFRQIEAASALDAEATIKEYSVTGTFTETRTLDTATATLADVVNLLATLISDIKRGGQKRSYGS